MVPGVDRVFELAGEEDGGVAGGHFTGEFDPGGVAVGGLEELDFAAQLPDEVAAFDAGGLAHEDVHAVALGGTDHGEGDTGVAAGALEDDGFPGEEAAGFGVLDDAEGEAVLDGAGGV